MSTQLSFVLGLGLLDIRFRRPDSGCVRKLATRVPRPAPQRVALEGRYTRLEPLSAHRHGETLFEALTAPGAEARFRYMADEPPTVDSFARWIERAEKGSDPLFYAVVERATGRCEGRQALMRIVPDHGVIEVGNIIWGPAIARTRVATEALYLTARYVFDELGYRRLEWKCDAGNDPSRRAAARFGFTFEGTFRQHMVIKGLNRDTAWFAMLDGEWPERKAAFEDWLAPENFDGAGRQRTRLVTVTP